MIKNIFLLYFIFISHFANAEKKTIYIFIEKNIKDFSEMRSTYEDLKSVLFNVISKFSIKVIDNQDGIEIDDTFDYLNKLNDIREILPHYIKKSVEPTFYIIFNLVNVTILSGKKIQIMRIQLFQLGSQLSFPICDVRGEDDIKNFSKDLSSWFDNSYTMNKKLILPKYINEHFDINEIKERLENNIEIKNKFSIETSQYQMTPNELESEYSECKKIYVFNYKNLNNKEIISVFDAYHRRSIPEALDGRNKLKNSNFDDFIAKIIKILKKLN